MYQISNKFIKRSVLSALMLSLISFSGPAFAQTTANTDTAVVQLTSAERYENAIQALLANGGNQLADFAKFYAQRAYQPIWANGNSGSMLALLTAIEQAPAHGLPLSRYNVAELEALWVGATTPEDLAALELAAARSYVRFAKEISAGMLDPRSIHKEMNATRKVPKTSVLLANVAGATDMAAFYRTLPPSSPEYTQMLKLKIELEALVSSKGWGPLVPTGRTLRPGQSDDRVVALRVRLSHRGYAVDDTTSPVFDDLLVEAVKVFQKDFGLNADGLVGPQTLSSINAQPDSRLQQVMVNLERLRWMNYELGARHIYVNIPDFMASVVDNGAPTLSFRIVVGTGKNQTAEFSDSMTHMIANPTWHVPYSIASEEYLPQLRADPTVLQRSNIKMLVRGSGQIVDSTAIDYTQFTEDNFPFVLQQRPSSNNALGLVKFMFPNKYNIYLHDTPSKSLFARDARAFSHGCVRVQKPMELAYTLLSLQEADPEAAFKRVLNTGQETQIDLVSPIPVHIVYRTVWFDAEGLPQYRHDVYGRDKMVFDALIAAGVTLATVEG